MKLSTRARYGLRIITQIAAENDRDRPVLARELSQEQEITPAYVDQILIPLRQNGLVTSFRGRHGGYKLGRAADDITALEVVETLEGDLNLVDCVHDKEACKRSPTCPVRHVWQSVSTAIKKTLSQYTVADLAMDGQNEDSGKRQS